MVFKRLFRKHKRQSSRLKKLESKVRTIARRGELKFINNYPTNTISLTASYLLNTTGPQGWSAFVTADQAGSILPTQGTGVMNRIGKKITVKSIKFMMQFYSFTALGAGLGNGYINIQGTTNTAIYDPTGQRQSFRFMIIHVKGENTSIGSNNNYNIFAHNMLDASGSGPVYNYPTYMRNLITCPAKNFKVLHDKTFTFSNNDPCAGSHIINHHLSFPKGHIVEYDDGNGIITDGDIIYLLYTDSNNDVTSYGVYPNFQVQYYDE